MTRPRKVVFYGNSLLLASLDTSLGERDDLRLEFIKARRPESARQLQAVQPDVIVFTLAVARPDFILSLFPAQPKARLIGVDLEGRRLLALSGQEIKGLAVSDLLGAILGTVPSSEEGSGTEGGNDID